MRAAEHSRIRGMSLIEVLVAMVVVSLGALSATSLQIIAKRTNRDAAQRLEATHVASTLIERMRANNSNTALATYVSLGTYSASTVPRPIGGGRLAYALAPSCGVDANACCPTGTSCCVSGSSCNGAQVAAVELYQLEWVMDGLLEQANGVEAGGLDSPTACVSGPVLGTNGFYEVTIAFRGSLAMPEDTGVACGHDAAVGGVKIYGPNNEFRRTLTVTAYIAPAAPK
jgi:type IV pilus assembly protein PilV